jgi:hypothetical protein
MKVLIEGYRNVTGEHCGSAAMRNLLHHYCGLDLPEEVIFGLGSGIDFLLVTGGGLAAAVTICGRGISMELDVAQALGVNYVEQIELDDEKAWLDVRREVEQGRPTMLSGDVFYLDYRKYTVHFPAHRFVLLGYDDDAHVAYLADRIDPEPQACSFEALAKSRNSPEGFSDFNLWGKFHGTTVENSLEKACRVALRRSADRMLGRDTVQQDLIRAVTKDPTFDVVTGLAGLARFARELPEWCNREDAAHLASFNYRCIEKFGTGGGNFRKMYAAFLRWARERLPDRVTSGLPDLAMRSAERWTVLASHLRALSEDPEQAREWEVAGEMAREIQGLEAELFEALDRGNSQ